MVDQFIFGYGSLINTKSRTDTSETGKPIPARVKGLQRAWNIVVPRYSQTGVGVVYDSQSTCNGVIVPVSEIELPKFDERELQHGYTRTNIKRRDIEAISREQGEGQLPNGIVWVYLAKTHGIPSDPNPIAQSYLDVILAGCLGLGEDLGEKFAKEFIETTQGWEHPWVNDRTKPRYSGAMKDVPLATTTKIDGLLERLIPDAYNKRTTL